MDFFILVIDDAVQLKNKIFGTALEFLKLSYLSLSNILLDTNFTSIYPKTHFERSMKQCIIFFFLFPKYTIE